MANAELRLTQIPSPQSPIANPQSPIPNPQSPIANPQSPIPSRQSPIPNPQSPIMKIALFGTSADPPTTGHQTILDWLSSHYDRVAVWAADNPFKSHQASLSHRAAMLQLLIADLEAPQANIALEQDLSSLKTIETLTKARKRWGDNTEFTLVIGSDLLTQLPRWYQARKLLQQVKLLVVPRPGYAINQSNLQAVQNLGGEIAIASLTGPNISSTDYRESGNLEALTPSVAAYILIEHLYECQDNSNENLQMQ